MSIVKKFFSLSIIIGIIACLSMSSDISYQLFVTKLYAAVRTFIGIGSASLAGSDDIVTVNLVKKAALNNAIQNAKEQAGIYVRNESKTIDNKLTEDKITVLTNTLISGDAISNVKYKSVPFEAFNASGQSLNDIGTCYEATVSVKIDTNYIYQYLKLPKETQSLLAAQDKSIQDTEIAGNRKFENLNRQAQSAKTDFERSKVKTETIQLEKEFEAMQKLNDGYQLYFKGDANGLLQKCNESIQIKPDLAVAYCIRGIVYINYFNQPDKALTDFDTSIRLNPNLALAHCMRGLALLVSKNDISYCNQSLNSINKAIQLEPKEGIFYYFRATIYQMIGEAEKANADIAKFYSLS